MDILITDYTDILWPDPPEEFYDLVGRGLFERDLSEEDKLSDLLPDELFEI